MIDYDRPISFPEFCAAVHRLPGTLLPSQECALDALAEADSEPRMVAVWCAEFKKLSQAYLDEIVQEVASVSERLQQEREEAQRDAACEAWFRALR